MMLMHKLQQERLVRRHRRAGERRAGAAPTRSPTAKERKAFGRPIGKFQNTQFKLAECATKVEVGRAFLDKLVAEHVGRASTWSRSARWPSCGRPRWLGEVVDACLQFFGGYGYMLEYPVTRAYMDARVQRIYAGTNEIMKVIIAKQMGL